MKLRRIVLQLDKRTRDGDSEIAILTNLPQGAVATAELYRKRWTLETMIQSLTMMLAGELNTLGYPRAALLGFGIALASHNVLSAVQAALRAQFGVEKVQNEVRATATGMSIAIESSVWEPFQTMPPAALAQQVRG